LRFGFVVAKRCAITKEIGFEQFGFATWAAGSGESSCGLF
jgi:hypothetical protein